MTATFAADANELLIVGPYRVCAAVPTTANLANMLAFMGTAAFVDLGCLDAAGARIRFSDKYEKVNKPCLGMATTADKYYTGSTGSLELNLMAADTNALMSIFSAKARGLSSFVGADGAVKTVTAAAANLTAGRDHLGKLGTPGMFASQFPVAILLKPIYTGSTAATTLKPTWLCGFTCMDEDDQAEFELSHRRREQTINLELLPFTYDPADNCQWLFIRL